MARSLQAPDRRGARCPLQTINEGPKLGDLPTLWLHGEDNQLVPLNETRAGIDTLAFTDLEEIVYPQARHEVFNETNKDEVLKKTADFIDSATNSATRRARA